MRKPSKPERLYVDFDGFFASCEEQVANIARSIEDSDDYGWVNLASMDSRILGAAPDLDSRTYSCTNLSTRVPKCNKQ